MIRRCELPLAQPFNDGDDGGVHESKVQVCAPFEEFANSNVVRADEIDESDRAVLQVGQKCGEWLGAEPAACQPLELDDHRSRDEQLLDRSGQEFGAGPVVGIGSVHRGVERAGVADQRHERCWYLISPARRAVSAGGSVEAPAAMRRRLLCFFAPALARHALSALSTWARSGMR